MYRRVLAVLAALAIILPPFFPSGQAQESELVLRVAMQDDMKGTNPLTVGDVWSWNVLGFLFDSPMNFDEDAEKFTPYIAIGSAAVSGKADSWADCAIGNFGYSPMADWENASKQEATIFYDFTNVKWHDGHQMDIRDIMFSYHAAVFSYESAMSCLLDEYPRYNSWDSSVVWNAYPIHIYKAWESSDKLQAALRFQLQKPYSDFFKETLSVMLLPEHIWTYRIAGQTVDGAKIWCDPGYNASLTSSWQFSAAYAYDNYPPIGSGPFKFEFWTKGQMSKITTWREHFFRDDYKFKDYVGFDEYGRSLARQPQIDAIVYTIFRTVEAAVLALKANDIDYIAWPVPPTFIPELANEPGVALQQTWGEGFSYMAYNMRRASFGYNETGEDIGKPLRQAIAHCIDKNRIVTRLLLNLGIPGNGPISPLSELYNNSAPEYDFDPDEAKQILADAGYKVLDGTTYLTGDDAIAAAGNGNWWVNPNGTPIGSGEDGIIEIICKEANYEPRQTSEGLMIAQQARDIGIYAQAVAYDLGSIVDRMNHRDFDMYIQTLQSGLSAMYELSRSPLPGYYDYDYNQNYPGYNNLTYNKLIDLAQGTQSDDLIKKAIFDAQAAISYDLPIDVLYFKASLEAYRSDRFTGWVTGSSGSIFCWESILNIRGPSPYKVNAQFVSPPSAMQSNSSIPITIYVRDQNGNPLEGAKVWLNASKGVLSEEYGETTSTGKFTTTFTAPWADPFDPELQMNGTSVLIQIVKATYIAPDYTLYNPAPSRLTLIKVFNMCIPYLSISLSADPDIINPDMNPDGTFGFTYVDVIVTNNNLEPVVGASVALSVSPAVLIIEPDDQLTDSEGKARFKVTTANLSNDDGMMVEYVLKAKALHPTDVNIRGENIMSLSIVDAVIGDPPPPANFPMIEIALIVGAISLVIIAVAIIVRRKHP